MSLREAVLATALGGLALFAWCGDDGESEAMERVRSLEAALPVVASQRDSALAAAERADRTAAALDTAVAQLRDSVEILNAQDDVELDARRDTIRVLVQDTTALRLLDERDSIFAARIARDSVVIDSVTTWGLAWRASSFAKDTVIWRLQAQDSLRLAINNGLRDRIAELDGPDWKDRAVSFLAGAGACALFCR